LPPTLTFGLTDPATGRLVKFDDCRESDGAMIEAKGHYARVRGSAFLRDEINDDWIDQATRQVKASGGRQIEWYFHEQAAADQAREAFDEFKELQNIKIIVAPYPTGVPHPNPRIK